MQRVNISFYRPITDHFQNNSWFVLCVILALATLLRLLNLNQSLWFDELWSTHVKLGNIFLLGYQVLYDPHPPFYYIFIFFWIKLFGDSELSIRIPPLIFGILAIFLTYLLALRFAGKKEAILASLLLCLSPVHIWYSDEARPYSATLFLLLLSIFSYYKLKGSKENSFWYFAYFVAVLFAVFSHYYMVVYLGIFTIMCFFKMDRMKRKVTILNILILVSFISFLGLKSFLGKIDTGQGHLRPFTLFEFWMLFFNWFLMGNSIWNINPFENDPSLILGKPLMLVTQAVFSCFFIHGLIRIVKDSKNIEDSNSVDLILYVFSLPLLILGLNLIGFKKIYIERSMFFILPFFFIILIKGATGFKVKPISIASIIFTISLSIISLTSFLKKSDEWTVYQPKPDWHAAVRYFNDELKDGTKRLFIFAAKSPTELTYYDPRFQEDTITGINLSGKTISKLEKLSEKDYYFGKKLNSGLSEYIRLRKDRISKANFIIFSPIMNNNQPIHETLSANNVETFYLINKTYWQGDFKGLLESVMSDSRFQHKGTQSFKGIEIYKFRLAS